MPFFSKTHRQRHQHFSTDSTDDSTCQAKCGLRLRRRCQCPVGILATAPEAHSAMVAYFESSPTRYQGTRLWSGCGYRALLAAAHPMSSVVLLKSKAIVPGHTSNAKGDAKCRESWKSATDAYIRLVLGDPYQGTGFVKAELW